MATWAALSDVQARVAGRTLGASSSPTSTQVSTWIDEAEAIITGALQAGQCSLPAAASTGDKIITSWVCDYCEGHVRQAWVAAGGDGSDDGMPLLDKFYKIIDDILANPSRYDAMLNGGGSSASARHMRSHVLDNSDELTVDDGDFDPVFELSNDDPSEKF